MEDGWLAVDEAAREVAALAEPLARQGQADAERLLRAVAVLLGTVHRARRGDLAWPVDSVPQLLDRLAEVLDGLPVLMPAGGAAAVRIHEARRLCAAARLGNAGQ